MVLSNLNVHRPEQYCLPHQYASASCVSRSFVSFFESLIKKPRVPIPPNRLILVREDDNSLCPMGIMNGCLALLLDRNKSLRPHD